MKKSLLKFVALAVALALPTGVFAQTTTTETAKTTTETKAKSETGTTTHKKKSTTKKKKSSTGASSTTKKTTEIDHDQARADEGPREVRLRPITSHRVPAQAGTSVLGFSSPRGDLVRNPKPPGLADLSAGRRAPETPWRPRHGFESLAARRKTNLRAIVFNGPFSAPSSSG